MDCNQVVLTGRIAEMNALRYTPAGLPLMAFRISHVSEQIEAGFKRKAECEIAAIMMGDPAKTVAGWKVGDSIKAAGFLAKKSQHSQQLVLHLNRIELIERG
ncbi:MAG: primosomal replication protein N [Hydrogenophilales bacterium CG_4_9_14_3_um_filter_59_35]|nr:MAG: primosomal replication protein N [Hydrogenophilales bacterium CG18_big_fil_WC_8_21_14_2_50_58_12]PIX98838.1 MAG: primosomal replication protein N [Hydrogenophilales bacterium CG_4_10_14_3_um_filter_58_23]PJB08164.1 MAG: primosomal replication protein N [Hydrogenophilales bacterium CG_4_9_14_3_um_filter_59_35]